MNMSDFLNKRFWKYRGKRIHPYMRNNVKLAGAIIFVPVFLLSMFIFWREQLINFDLSQVIKHFEWNMPLIIKSVLCSVLIAVGSIAASYFLFFDSYKKILHRQKIAKMIFSNKFYEKEGNWAVSGQ